MPDYGYVERVLGKLGGPEPVSGGWVARCPCPGHGGDGRDANPSLSVAVGNNGTVLLRCRVGCPFWGVLSALGLEPRDLRPNPYLMEDPHPPTVEWRQDKDEEYGGDVEALLDRAYRKFLSLLPLEKEHARDLMRRGLSRAEQAQRGYRSLRSVSAAPAVKDLYKEFGDEIYQVPGFVEEGGRPRLKDDLAGLLVPVLSRDNRVVALKVRRADDRPKYCYLTSFPHGRSPGSPAHHPAPILGQTYDRVRVTEGELKADAATALSGLYTLGLPGVSSWYKAVAPLSAWGTKDALVSFDWRDVRIKRPVAEAALQLVRALRAKGLSVGVEVWDPVYKGVDDLLEAGLSPAEVWDDVEDFLLSQPAFRDAPKKESWSPPPFPEDVLPDPLRLYVRAVSKSLPCPPDFLGVSLLVAASALLGRSRAVRVKDSWKEEGNLWAAIVAPPGAMKTPAVKKVMAPLKAIQAKVIEDFQEDHAAWEGERVVYRAREAAYKGELRKFFAAFPLAEADDEDAPDPPAPLRPEPRQPHLFTDDVTLEALAVVLQDSPRGVLRETDEFLGIFRSFDQYKGKGADRQGYLSLWSGASIKVDRKSAKGSLIVQHPFFSLLGGIQPDMLGELEDDKGREDGMVHRILFSMPEAEPVPPMNFEDDVPLACDGVWAAACVALFKFSQEEGGSPKVLPLSVEGGKAFLAWYDRHRLEALAPSFPKSLLGPWSKFKAYLVRLALVLHCLREACCVVDPDGGWCHGLTSEVDEKDVLGAERLVEYFKGHCKGVYGKLQFDRDDQVLEDFAAWAREQGGKVALRDVVQKPRFRTKGRESVLRLFHKAQDRGLGEVFEERSKETGKVSKVFLLGAGGEA